MPTTSVECAPHQSRKAAESVRRITHSITVSASLTTACDTTVGASEDAPPLPKSRTRKATEGPKGTRSAWSRASERYRSSRTRPQRGQPRRVRRRCPARRPRHCDCRQVSNRHPRQERRRWPARRPRPNHWSSRSRRCHIVESDRRDSPANTPATSESARDRDQA